MITNISDYDLINYQMTQSSGTLPLISNICPKCGKPFVYVGDVSEGGYPPGVELPYCTCSIQNEAQTPIQQPLMYGWICPKCGASLSPFTSECFRCNIKETKQETCDNCSNQKFNETMGCENYIQDFKCRGYKPNQ